MGLEMRECTAVVRGATSIGRLHVDSNELEFRSPDLKWKVKVGSGTAAKVRDGLLSVRRGSKSATFSLGPGAEKWLDKILNPPTRSTKLGLKPGSKYWISGDVDDSFIKELKTHGLTKSGTLKACDIAFLFIQTTKDLKSFDKAAKSCAAGTAIWMVWPKGNESIKQSEVIACARSHGIGPGKGISFDEIHSAMRFTLK